MRILSSALVCLLAPGALAQEGEVPGQVLFTFAIFGDNKGGGEVMETSFRNMKRIKPSFLLGMGDHFQSQEELNGFDGSICNVFGETGSFYRRFYFTAGDNEAGAYAGRQDVPGAERPFFYHAGMFDKKTDKPLRGGIVDYDERWFDYYAQLTVRGIRLHLLNLYDQDSVRMQDETVEFANRVSARVLAEHPGEAWIVMAHDGNWWKRSFPKGHAVYSCDLLLGASWHVYKRFGKQGGGSCMAFNTSAVGRGARSWYAVMALRDRFVLLNIDDRRFRVKARPGCHVKPFGRPGFDGDAAAWFARLTAYGASVEDDWGPPPAELARSGDEGGG